VAKEKKTSSELEEMIQPHLEEFEVASFSVEPTPDGKSWFPIVVVWGTEHAGPAQAAAERTAEQLREQYDLKTD
jgi:hypothetical protein